MATLSIPNTFVNATPADATLVNANFAEVATQVNDIDEDNVADGALPEAKILFNGTGHNHSGGADGELIPLAAANGTQGIIKWKSGSVVIANTARAEITFAGVAFTSIPIIQVSHTNAVDMTRAAGTGGEILNETTAYRDHAQYDVGDAAYIGHHFSTGAIDPYFVLARTFIVYNMAIGGFSIYNGMGASYTFNWRAIGI